MEGGRSFREGSRFPKRKSHARPDRIIEKRPNWQDYLDPEEDPGLLELEPDIEPDLAAADLESEAGREDEEESPTA
ncbi:MAG: hypothetical protein ACE15D_15470 [Candidatus Eisenbacteria bacterium]